MSLTVAVYELVERLPPDERFERSAQMRRAAVSVPSNIAEGYGHRDSPKTYAKHVRVALGSLAELRLTSNSQFDCAFFAQGIWKS